MVDPPDSELSSTGSTSELFVSATGIDWLLPWYDPLVALFTRESAFKRKLLCQASLRENEDVLDLGCGSGTLLRSALQLHPDCRFTGVDIDERMLVRARKKLGGLGSVRWLRGPATQLPIENASMDVVTSSLLLHHLTPEEKRDTLLEIVRVLRPGGRLLLVDFCRPTDPCMALAFLLVRMIDGWNRTQCNARGQIPLLISQSGLTDVGERFSMSTALGTLRCFYAAKRS